MKSTSGWNRRVECRSLDFEKLHVGGRKPQRHLLTLAKFVLCGRIPLDGLDQLAAYAHQVLGLVAKISPALHQPGRAGPPLRQGQRLAANHGVDRLAGCNRTFASKFPSMIPDFDRGSARLSV